MNRDRKWEKNKREIEGKGKLEKKREGKRRKYKSLRMVAGVMEGVR